MRLIRRTCEPVDQGKWSVLREMSTQEERSSYACVISLRRWDWLKKDGKGRRPLYRDVSFRCHQGIGTGVE